MKGKKAKITQAKIDKLLSIGFDDSLEDRVALGLADDEDNGGGGGGDGQLRQQHIPAEEDTQQQMQQQHQMAPEGGVAVAYSHPVAAQHPNQGPEYWTGAWAKHPGPQYQA